MNALLGRIRRLQLAGAAVLSLFLYMASKLKPLSSLPCLRGYAAAEARRC